MWMRHHAEGLTFVVGDSSGRVHFLRLVEPDKNTRPAGATKTLIFGRKNLPDSFSETPRVRRKVICKSVSAICE
jgi:hypothetical protein